MLNSLLWWRLGLLLTYLIPLCLHSYCRSDVLGQFMPLVGIDWSQTGVAHLFSAIQVCCLWCCVLNTLDCSNHLLVEGNISYCIYHSLHIRKILVGLAPKSAIGRPVCWFGPLTKSCGVGSKAFYDIRIAPCKACQELSTWVERHWWPQQSLPQHDALAIRTHEPGSNTIYWIGHSTISFENQLASSEESQSLLLHSNSISQGMLSAVHVCRAALLTPTPSLVHQTI